MYKKGKHTIFRKVTLLIFVSHTFIQIKSGTASTTTHPSYQKKKVTHHIPSIKQQKGPPLPKNRDDPVSSHLTEPNGRLFITDHIMQYNEPLGMVVLEDVFLIISSLLEVPNVVLHVIEDVLTDGQDGSRNGPLQLLIDVALWDPRDGPLLRWLALGPRCCDRSWLCSYDGSELYICDFVDITMVPLHLYEPGNTTPIQTLPRST